MTEWVQRMIDQAGYVGLFLFSIFQNFFPPLPEEVVFPQAGYAAQRGNLAFWGIVAAGTIGATLGALVVFFIGRKLGEKRIHDWADKHGKWFTISGEDIDKMDRYFESHGHVAVFVCRLVPGLRSVVSIPAGFSKMSVVKFVIAYASAAFLWTLGLTYAGFFLGQNFNNVDRYLNFYTYAVLGLAVIAYVFRLVKHRGGKKQQPQSPPSKRPVGTT